MYITITPQKLGDKYSQSVAGFVQYLEKENQELEPEEEEFFFNQYEDKISGKEVVKEIDGNTAKLKKIEPKFYSITVNPSKHELKGLQNSSEDLKNYTRELMKDYVSCFNRELNGKPIRIEDIKYYAKIEHQRTFKGSDIQIRENQPTLTEIQKLRKEIRNIESGQKVGSIKSLEKQIVKLERAAPHRQNDQIIVRGMKKEVMMNGKLVKRGFDRDQFFAKAEKTFDKTFSYNRNFVETYQARKEFVKNTNFYFMALLRLPTNEKAIAFKMLRESGMPIQTIPTSSAQLALKVFNRLRKGLVIAIKSSSIGI